MDNMITSLSSAYRIHKIDPLEKKLQYVIKPSSPVDSIVSMLTSVYVMSSFSSQSALASRVSNPEKREFTNHQHHLFAGLVHTKL